MFRQESDKNRKVQTLQFVWTLANDLRGEKTSKVLAKNINQRKFNAFIIAMKNILF